MIRLKQLILENSCFACQGGCCSYDRKDTIWAPFFMREEIAGLVDNNIVPSSVFSGTGLYNGEVARADLVKYDGVFLCPCFDIQKGKCKIYPYRPLDCQLYPFLLAQKENTAYLAAAENCPYIQKPGWSEPVEEYIRYLAGVFSSDSFLQLAKNNPGIVQDYGQEVAYLLPLPELTQAIHAPSANKS